MGSLVLPSDTISQICKTEEDIIPEIKNVGNECSPKSSKRKIKIDEDNNIEDLDLQLEGAPISVIKDVSEEIIKKELDKDSCITELSPAPSENDTAESSPSLSSGLGMSFTDNINLELDDKPKFDSRQDFIDEDCNSNDNEVVTIISSDIKSENVESEMSNVASLDYRDVFQYNATAMKLNTEENMSTELTKGDCIENNINKSQENKDDEFEDFDDFQGTSLQSHTLNSTIDENPWGNEMSQDFGEFQANFDELEKDHNKTDTINIKLDKNELNVSNDNNDDDDDFGDFNDFKSSGANVQEITNSSSSSDVPVLNLETLGNEVYMERINKILGSIFGEEVSPVNEKFDKTIDSLLCETWGHLIETEIRQPYMVTWNNSLGQKTLLKALCIDSRNIVSICH